MLQYLLNATATWGISLALFDLILQKQSFHSYNRFYLLFTFLLGALLPLVNWIDDASPYILHSVEHSQVVILKQRAVEAVAPGGAANFDWVLWLRLLYVVGTFAATLYLAVDVVKVVHFYRTGQRRRRDGWTIVETDREHAPFSLMNLLFVRSVAQYSPAEWRIIAAHEQRHARLWHVADLLLLQAGRVLFWFHPFVYIYCRRLVLVHEYQADQVFTGSRKSYGAFLVAQALLFPSPNIVHSLNRSPIKNRILMLSNQSTVASRARMIVFLPLAVVCMLCFSRNSFSQDVVRTGNYVTVHGNIVKMMEPRTDTMVMIDPVTGAQVTRIATIMPIPKLLNGKKIEMNPDYDPDLTGSERNLRKYLLENLKKELLSLEDGQYQLNLCHIVIDENGKVGYYEYGGITRYEQEKDKPGKSGQPNANTARPVNQEKENKIGGRLARLLVSAPAFKPATLDGKPVPAFYGKDILLGKEFQVRDHKLMDVDSKGAAQEL